MKQFFSISSNPGTMGFTLYNNLFKKLGFNGTYKPLKIKKIDQILSLFKKKSFSGLSISMPFKSKILNLPCRFSQDVIKTSSCNTIVKKKDYYFGYNTDTIGISQKLKKLKIKKDTFFYIYGSGGFARSYCYALSKEGFKNIFIIIRNNLGKDKKVKLFKKISTVKFLNNFPKKIPNKNCIINCSPIGMPHITKGFLNNIDTLKTTIYFECVISPKITSNVQISLNRKIKTIYGYEIYFEQFLSQFKLYTGFVVPKKYTLKLLNQIFDKK